MTSSVPDAEFLQYKFFVPDAPQRSDCRCDDAAFDVTSWPRVPVTFNYEGSKCANMTGSSNCSPLDKNFLLLIFTNIDFANIEQKH